ncbi:MAG: glycoside hydrolase family 31 protein [Clostridia bacterium]|nr:glycoside hydrolase family 31 protein [Clostridia bacterium]
MPHIGFARVGPIARSSTTAAGIVLEAPESHIEVTAITEDLIRVHMTYLQNGLPSHGSAAGSFSVEDAAWPTVNVIVEDGPESARLSTGKVEVEIEKNPLRIVFRRPDGSLICADSEDSGMGWHAGGAGCFKSFAPDSHFYGFGEKMGFLDKRGSAMMMWNTDVNPHNPDTDPLYMSIPFFIGFSKGSFYGIFLDTAARSTFNMGKPSPAPFHSRIDLPEQVIPDVDPGEYWFGAFENELDYYFFSGPAMPDVVRRYSDLTGRMQLPPLWALGYHQCRFSYNPASQVLDVARAFRRSDIPCDAIYLDIDYMDGFRVFTFDPETFPDPKSLVDELAYEGFNVVTIVDPGVKVDPKSKVYREGKSRGCYVKRPDGTEFHGAVWPGVVAFPDFARADVREWWAGNHATLFGAGVRGIWNDMNEPACFDTESKTMDLDALHGEPGSEVAHCHVHNAYGNLMAKATQEAFRTLLPIVRPFIITRAGCGGIQRDACVWTGDNSSWWEHLLTSVPMCLNMSMSGVSLVGSDVGGFMGDSDPELVTRWTQLGAFVPLFRNHSMIRSAPQEPYALGEPYTSICRKFIKLRYRLIPYLYTLMRQCAEDGTPVMRPMVYEFPADERAHTMYDQYMLGRDIMVAPVYQPGAEHRIVYFPEGRWGELLTGQVFTSVGEHLLIDSPIDRIPVFLREGAVLPWGRQMNHVRERVQAIEIADLFPSASIPRGQFSMYVDDGASLDYRKGEFGFIDLSYALSECGTITADIRSRDENYPCTRPLGVIRVWDRPGPPARITVNGKRLAEIPNMQELASGTPGYFYDSSCRRLSIGVHAPASTLSILIEQ